ncbi:hypothetical protein FPV67DRAFT_1665236 [Lyophyllum atratum]|nr:hypothetical protein FPV67DRAFT_1683443 [Lyophyllum atratum]KAF8054093.1 hypothetical protein FPV67DRAFT_1683432 [Lyophyllum atratum]KAF8054501.1 hypothetical protein FPV67DRAFT_1682583 [Lyophyllum atratum]KAF8056158.1 hypothetical protein FPV67DRAFT_1678301 [Lyophyllum atratum]KAF8057088.1 hypothetical protein FPV67DRAFT_1677846 [Lyophyllum atratum]
MEDKHPAPMPIVSSVGSAGLDLTFSDVLIFIDQPWSALEQRQIGGRAHGQPQTTQEPPPGLASTQSQHNTTIASPFSGPITSPTHGTFAPSTPID